jgi:hypothetical protein
VDESQRYSDFRLLFHSELRGVNTEMFSGAVMPKIAVELSSSSLRPLLFEVVLFALGFSLNVEERLGTHRSLGRRAAQDGGIAFAAGAPRTKLVTLF